MGNKNKLALMFASPEPSVFNVKFGHTKGQLHPMQSSWGELTTQLTAGAMLLNLEQTQNFCFVLIF